MLSWASVYWCLAVNGWEMADLLALVYDVWLWICHFPIGILGQVWCLIVSIPDLCPLSFMSLQFALVKQYTRKKTAWYSVSLGIWGLLVRVFMYCRRSHCIVSLSKILYPLFCSAGFNPGRPVSTWLKNCWLGRKESKQRNKTRISRSIFFQKYCQHI